MKGIIKRWFDFRGYGFLQTESENDDIFVHISAFRASDIHLIKEGLEVEFDVKKTNRGLEADKIRVPT